MPQPLLDTKWALSTSSLGLHPTAHTLPQKLAAIGSTHAPSFSGVEIVYHELEAYSKTQDKTILQAAADVREICSQRRITVLSLCPFENFEGARMAPLGARLDDARRWIQVARALGALHMQVPAQFLEGADTARDVLVSELQQLADLARSPASEPVVRIAYEPMSWSTVFSTWESTLPLLDAVGRDNFGVCVDTFHLASRVCNSPLEASGLYPDGGKKLALSLARFVREFPVEKLFYVQLSDGELFDPPFSERHPWFVEGEAPEFTWSKHARPFPLETELGGYMPVVEMVRGLVVDKGFDGWVSLESFDRRMRDGRVGVEESAARAERSVTRLKEALGRGLSRL